MELKKHMRVTEKTNKQQWQTDSQTYTNARSFLYAKHISQMYHETNLNCGFVCMCASCGFVCIRAVYKLYSFDTDFFFVALAAVDLFAFFFILFEKPTWVICITIQCAHRHVTFTLQFWLSVQNSIKSCWIFYSRMSFSTLNFVFFFSTPIYLRLLNLAYLVRERDRGRKKTWTVWVYKQSNAVWCYPLEFILSPFSHESVKMFCHIFFSSARGKYKHIN